ncbi:oligopeptide ABC transporter permease OppB [Fluviispira multicolorata]|uniref:Oligopeptide ABC transporter permease OppB n=1 Tax=Fluviispira multicolorata TaxID=2654512 RepID=A0A833JGG7_9BACT|nr:oligopeptide ABC transporter permease OppB [Fluviispira multicolorata]KAB8032071.1 oligopeptide ABC transporter permease OppB [Fluviispira multicolorata]
MVSYTIKRFFGAWPTLLVVVTLSFFLMRLAPGGPFSGERVLTPAVQANLDAKYHLNDPVIVQYFDYLWSLLRGDFGPSFKYPDWTVNQLIAQGFPVSIWLGGWAIIIAVFIGILIGSLAAFKQNTWIDYLATGMSMTGISIPSFVTAPMMTLLFAVILHWLPAGGWNDGAFSSMVLPVTALALPQIAIVSRIMRGSMIEVLKSNYIRTAKAKGIPNRIIIFRHAIRPAILPVVSYLGPATAGIITGSVVIEQIFSLPGLGSYITKGALNRDYTLVLGTVILFAAIIIAFNFIVDVLYAIIDPKIKY